jgi:surface protein
MANKLYNESSIQDIADAIRSVNGSTDLYKVSEMPAAIENISTGLNWAELNYNTSGPNKGTPLEIVNGFNYAKTIMENYTDTSTYVNDLNLILWPNIDITERINYQNMFNGSALLHCDSITLGQLKPTGTITTNNMFNETNIEYIEINSVNNEPVNFDGTFRNCKRLKTAQINAPAGVSIAGMFEGCEALTTVNAFNTNNVTSHRYIFKNCKSLIAPPLIDTSNSTLFNEMFNGCAALENVPIYNTAACTNFTSMFNGCNSLTDLSLDNILVMCINATAYNGNKKLSQLGISNIYDTRIQALEHYQDFLDAGWIIG